MLKICEKNSSVNLRLEIFVMAFRVRKLCGTFEKWAPGNRTLASIEGDWCVDCLHSTFSLEVSRVINPKQVRSQEVVLLAILVLILCPGCSFRVLFRYRNKREEDCKQFNGWEASSLATVPLLVKLASKM